MKSVIVVVLLAVAAYFLLRPTTFKVKNDVFMYKSPEDVYEFMSDLKRTIEKHSIGGKCSLLKQRTRPDGVKEKLFLVEKTIPLFWDYEFPFNLEIRLTLAKPNKELLYNFGFVRGYLLKLQGRMTFERREGRAMPGTFLTEVLTVTCPWLAQTFVEKNLKETHKDTLISLRNGLESMPAPRDRTRAGEEMTGGREEGGTKKAEKRKETVSTDNKEKARRKNEARKPSSGQETKASKPSGQERKERQKKEKQPAVDKKTGKKASPDADGKPGKAEKDGEGMQTSQTSGQKKDEPKKKRPAMDKKAEKVVEGLKTSQTVGKEKKKDPTKEGKMEKKASPGEDVKAKGVKKDGEGKKEGGRQPKSKTEKDVKKEEVRGKDGGGGKEARQRKEEGVKIEKVRTEGWSDEGKPESAKESGTGGQKSPEAPEVERIPKPVRETPKQKAKTGS